MIPGVAKQAQASPLIAKKADPTKVSRRVASRVSVDRQKVVLSRYRLVILSF